MTDQGINVLRIDSSGRQDGSQTRQLADEFLKTLGQTSSINKVMVRDVSEGMELIDHNWIAANFTDDADRSEAQLERLKTSDTLVAELEEADLLVIGVPVYNFGIPAALKAWVDQVARARKTFRYTENGPEGLLRNKKAVLIAASGGTEINSSIDFAVPYLTHVLGFLGIEDVEVIKAGQLMMDAEGSLKKAMQQINGFELKLAS